MTNTLLQEESSMLTKTLELEREPRRDDPSRKVTTAKTPVVTVLNVAHKTTELPRGYVTVDTLINEYEKDEGRARALQAAREKIADALYSDEKDTLRFLRLQRGLSQRKLAELIETTQSHIARIEHGADLQVSTLERIARALQIDLLDAFKAYQATKTKTADS